MICYFYLNVGGHVQPSLGDPSLRYSGMLLGSGAGHKPPDQQGDEALGAESHVLSWLPRLLALQPPATNASVRFDRLVGQVVKASPSRAEDPGFESRLRLDFVAVDSFQ